MLPPGAGGSWGNHTAALAQGLHTMHGLLTASRDFEPLAYLLITCVVLFFGALAAGFSPLVFKLTEKQLGCLSAGGAGILVGTSLAVIIPEGFGAAGEGEAVERAAGAALVAGFFAMLLLDQFQHRWVGGHGHAHGHGHGSLARRSPQPGEEEGFLEEGLGRRAEAKEGQGQRGGLSAPARALLGLLVHSAADGLAVGASSVSGDRDLSLAVAGAMVLHKAPVAFGLATYLLAARWPWARIRPALLLFAAASPAAALLTDQESKPLMWPHRKALSILLCWQYGGVALVPGLSSPAGVALTLLFSGGTFLHAACLHILPEVLGRSPHLSAMQLACLLGGAVVPLAFSALHHHHH